VGGKVSLTGLSLDPPRFSLLNNLLPKKYLMTEFEKSKKDYESGGKEPMNPEHIASHEPTAVTRDEDTETASQGQTGTDSPEAREKYHKQGMTKT
jgi:hypothetical protein